MRFWTLLCFVTATLAYVSAEARAALVRDVTDQAIVDRTRADTPQIISLLEQGETLAVAGSLESALRLFEQGRAQSPYAAGLFDRRACEVLTALNRREEAQNACWHALQELRTPAAVRATVRSLVSGPTAPSFAEIAQALSLVTYERARAPRQPQLTAAMCDIAESMGDGIMLQHCARELETIAPSTYPPAMTARAALASQCPPWRFWTGWLAIGVLALVTAAHALRGYVRRGAPPVASAGAVAFAAMLALSPIARADERSPWLSSWPIDDSNPEASVPSEVQLKKDPLQAGYFLQDLIAKAELASKRGDHMAAVKFYQAMLKTVPNRAIALTRICAELEAAGDLVQATNACGLALMLDGVTVGDYEHYVHLMVNKKGQFTDKETLAVTNVIAHMKQDAAGRAVGNQLECEFAARTSDMAKLSECTAALAASAPNDPKTIMYQWDLALRQKNFGAARQLATRAKAAGIKEDSLLSMEQATSAGESRQRWLMALVIVGVLILLSGITYAVVVMSRKRAEPTPA
jgi:tetratricopeptide (TPR) repeat protein